jgi:hypothetical protein
MYLPESLSHAVGAIEASRLSLILLAA